MAGNPLSRFEQNSPAYNARLRQIPDEMALLEQKKAGNYKIY